MSDAAQIALITAVPPTLAALGALAIGLRNSRKADAIHVLVNSQLTSVKTELVLALDKVTRLEEYIMRDKK